MIEREVAVLQRLQVAQHFVFGVMSVEHGMRENRVAAAQAGRNGTTAGGDFGIKDVDVGLRTECRQHGKHIGACARLVQRRPEL